MPSLERALRKAFQPDRLNYSHLANQEHFVHWHVIPRYEIDPIRNFAGEIFEDRNVGRHYKPIPEKMIASEVMSLIANEIRKYFIA